MDQNRIYRSVLRIQMLQSLLRIINTILGDLYLLRLLQQQLRLFLLLQQQLRLYLTTTVILRRILCHLPQPLLFLRPRPLRLRRSAAVNEGVDVFFQQQATCQEVVVEGFGRHPAGGPQGMPPGRCLLMEGTPHGGAPSIYFYQAEVYRINTIITIIKKCT